MVKKVKKLSIKKSRLNQYYIYIPKRFIRKGNLGRIILVKLNKFIFPGKITFVVRHLTKSKIILSHGIVTIPNLTGKLLKNKKIKIGVYKYDKI